MGHSSISITAEIYTHVDTKEIVKAGKILKGCTTDYTTAESIKKLKNAPIWSNACSYYGNKKAPNPCNSRLLGTSYLSETWEIRTPDNLIKSQVLYQLS